MAYLDEVFLLLYVLLEFFRSRVVTAHRQISTYSPFITKETPFNIDTDICVFSVSIQSRFILWSKVTEWSLLNFAWFIFFVILSFWNFIPYSSFVLYMYYVSFVLYDDTSGTRIMYCGKSLNSIRIALNNKFI